MLEEQTIGNTFNDVECPLIPLLMNISNNGGSAPRGSSTTPAFLSNRHIFQTYILILDVNKSDTRSSTIADRPRGAASMLSQQLYPGSGRCSPCMAV